MLRLSTYFIWLFFLLQMGSITSCKKESKEPPIDEAVDLDGSLINDSSLTNPAAFLVSSHASPSAADLSSPVVIAVHGFSATTFEWTEFRDWSKSKGGFLVSVILLGGHGRDHQDFKSATWEDWQSSIRDEFIRLNALGYKNINIVASSTGCPLVLNLIREKKIETDLLKHIWFIDPIITPANKTLSLVKVVGPALGFITNDMEVEEHGFWYKYSPYEALTQLEKLIRLERNAIEKGYQLPSALTLKVYKSDQDGTVDPISAVQIQKGVKNSDGTEIEVRMIQSDLHVFTRLHGRNEIREADRVLQLKTFEEIYSDL